MNKFQHVKTGATAELIEQQGSTTVKLKDLATGEVKEIGYLNFKRWWKEADSEATDSTKDEPSDAPEDEPEDETTKALENEPTLAQNEQDDKPEDKTTTDEENAATDDQNAPMVFSEIIAKLEGLYNLLNRVYFDNALPRPIITVQSTPKAYGHCTTKKIWNPGDERDGMYEINIGAEHLNRSSENTAATMCHEMVHLFCRENNIEETCQNGRYHNKQFKAEAEGRDLVIEYDRAIGYSKTMPGDDFVETLKREGFVLEIPFARHTLEKGKAPATRAKAHKYVCPICGASVRTTSELNLKCGDCDVAMDRV